MDIETLLFVKEQCGLLRERIESLEEYLGVEYGKGHSKKENKSQDIAQS